MNLTAYSYAGRISMGPITTPESMPDPERFLGRVAESLDTVEAALVERGMLDLSAGNRGQTRREGEVSDVGLSKWDTTVARVGLFANVMPRRSPVRAQRGSDRLGIPPSKVGRGRSVSPPSTSSSSRSTRSCATCHPSTTWPPMSPGARRRHRFSPNSA